MATIYVLEGYSFRSVGSDSIRNPHVRSASMRIGGQTPTNADVLRIPERVKVPVCCPTGNRVETNVEAGRCERRS